MFLDNLKKLMDERGLNNSSLSKQSGIPYTTIDGLFKRGSENIKLSTLKQLANYFNVDLDTLVLGKKTSSQKKHIDNEFADKFFSLDERGRKTIECLINFEYSQSQKRKTMSEYTVEAAREIKLFDLAASAGTGNYLTDSDYTFIGVGNDVPKSADFAIRVSGDSMEPKYHDKQIVYVKSQPDIENGQVGIFFLNGESYIKRFEKRSDGIYLVSFNSNYEPIEIKEWDEFKYFGCVLN